MPVNAVQIVAVPKFFSLTEVGNGVSLVRSVGAKTKIKPQSWQTWKRNGSWAIA